MRASSVRFSQPWQYYALLDIFSKFRTEHDIAEKAMIYAACSAHEGSERDFYQTIQLTGLVTGATRVQGSFNHQADRRKSSSAHL